MELNTNTSERTDIALTIESCGIIVSLTTSFLVGASNEHEHASFDKAMHRHAHSNYEIQFIAEGTCDILVEEKTFSFVKGDIIIIAPQVMHFVRAAGGCTRLSFRFSIMNNRKNQIERALESVTGIYASIKTKELVKDVDGQISNSISMLQNEIINMHMGWLDKLRAGFTSLLIDIARLTIGTGNRTMSQLPVDKFENRSHLIDSFFTESGERFQSRQELAEILGLSQRQLERLLQKYYGKSFREISLQARMESAEFYLANTELTVAEISEKLQYSSPNAFHAAFRRYFGISPADRRKL